MGPNTLLMVVLVAVVLGDTGDTLPALVIIRFATVVIGTTSLVVLCTAALEMKNRILFDDMQLIGALQSSAEMLLRKIIPRAANKGLDSLLSIETEAAPAAKTSNVNSAGVSWSLTPRVEVERCNGTTVIESDLVGSTALAATLMPIDVCIMLHDLYSRWDTIADEISGTEGGIVKITTIGDAYIAVAGPAFGSVQTTAETGALSAVHMACLMIEAAANARAVRHGDVTGSVLGGQSLQATVLDSTGRDTDEFDERRVADIVPKDGSLPGRPIGIRIGCSSGTIFGAVLGIRQFQWQIWGPALSEATRFEETGEPGKVHISKRTCALARSAIADFDKHLPRKLVFDPEEVALADEDGGKRADVVAEDKQLGFYARFV